MAFSHESDSAKADRRNSVVEYFRRRLHGNPETIELPPDLSEDQVEEIFMPLHRERVRALQRALNTLNIRIYHPLKEKVDALLEKVHPTLSVPDHVASQRIKPPDQNP